MANFDFRSVSVLVCKPASEGKSCSNINRNQLNKAEPPSSTTRYVVYVECITRFINCSRDQYNVLSGGKRDNTYNHSEHSEASQWEVSVPQTHSVSLSCIFFNARSLRNKLGDLKDLLQTLLYDVVLVFETWLSDKDSDALLISLTDFNVFRCDRPSRGGGVCIFVRRSFSCMQVSLPPIFDPLEVTAMDIKAPGGVVRFVSFYRPPNDLADPVLLGSVLDHLCRTYPVIIAGDFNLPHRLEKFCMSIRSWSPFVSWRMHEECINSICPLSYSLHQNVGSFVLQWHTHLVSAIRTDAPFSTSDHCVVRFNVFFPHRPRTTPKRYHNFKRADYTVLEDVDVMTDVMRGKGWWRRCHLCWLRKGLWCL